jgi:hypothetical protein
MITPFSWISCEQQGSVLIALCVASLALMKMLFTIGRALANKSENIPLGIINLELSTNEQRSASIVKVWKDQGLIAKAVRQTQLDFFFLLIYPAAISLACSMIAGNGDGLLMTTVGIVLSWAMLLCTPLDAFENLMILKMLSNNYAKPVPQLTSIAASLKFILIAVSLFLYIPYMLILKALPLFHPK